MQWIFRWFCGLSDYFSRFSTVFPSAHTLTLHSKRFSSLISATLKPSTGSSFKLLYSKAKALTADEFMFVLLWIAIDFDCESKILLSVLETFVRFATDSPHFSRLWLERLCFCDTSETLRRRITRWFWDKLERQWRQIEKTIHWMHWGALNYDNVQWRKFEGKAVK